MKKARVIFNRIYEISDLLLKTLYNQHKFYFE